MASAATSSAVTAAFGLPVRNGSTSTVLPPSSRAKAACPRKRMFIRSLLVLVVGLNAFLPCHLLELSRQLQAHRHTDEHAKAGLLGDERAHHPCALLGVVQRQRMGDLRVVLDAEPPADGQRLVEDALEPRGGVGDDRLRV